MQSPSNSQGKAIKHGNGPMLVLAGPGSGKTFVIIQRILYLIYEKQVRPDNILVISFSKASTLELKQRFQKQSKDKNKITENLSDEIIQRNYSKTTITEESRSKVNFATFHACFFHILKETYHYTSQDIITEKQKRDILKIILLDPAYKEEENRNQEKNCKQDKQKEGIQINLGKNQKRLTQKEKIKESNLFEENKISNILEKTEDYLQKISYYKNKGIKELKEKESVQFQQVFHAYNQEIHRQHKLDFDDMGLLCLQLFQKNPDVLEKWQEKFQYILIDEFQDINMVQFRIVQLLGRKYQNLFVVGDDDQSIYSFRGANPKIMLNFDKYYPNTEKILLETNYRCSEEIVRESLKVIEQNKVRFQKDIKAFQCEKIKEKVTYKSFENYQKEYTYIAEQIKELVHSQNYNYSDIACIFRTNQDMTGLAEYFARNKIPFVMKESCKSIFRHFIALDIRAYLQFFLEGKKRSDFLRIMNKPLRYLSRNAISALANETILWHTLKQYYGFKPYMVSYIEQLEQNDKWIQKLELYGACYYIRKVIGYEQYLKEYIKEQNLNWDEAKEILDFVQESTRNMRSLKEWKDYIEQYEKALKTSGEEMEGINIITMHACKGLEYPIVFLPDCNEGKVPHKKAVSGEEMEEERRMFYVAMTRAKSHLEILYIEDKMKKHLQACRFLKK